MAESALYSRTAYSSTTGRPRLSYSISGQQRHQVEVVLNLADFQRFLFEEAENPAVP